MKRIFIALLFALFCAPVAAETRLGLPDSPGSNGPFRLSGGEDRPGIQPGRVFLTREEIDALILPRGAKSVRLSTLERFTGNEEDGLVFRKISLAADGSRVRVVTGGGERLQPWSERDFYLATNQTTGLGIAVDRRSGEVRGYAKKNGSRLEIQGNLLGALQFITVDDQGSASCATEMGDQPISTADIASYAAMPSQSEALQGETISYEAVVAVETDNEWLAGFGDDVVEAQLWIEDTFLAMNVFFERDVETRLLIGDVFLRPASEPDPYSVTGGDRSGQLDEFGAYWKDNMGHVDRQFAAMFSGRDISSRSFSGIAWLDQYCDYGFSWSGRTPGSYSYNAIGSSWSASSIALYIGHELGHNMGSPHTHCYSPPVDECYNGEGGCFSGTASCPTSGRGSIMSYCHLRGGCSNTAEFHPTVQALIENRLAEELAAGCILPHSEPLGAEIETTPAAGATLEFGPHKVAETSPAIVVHVENTGDQVLDLSCGLTGVDAASFSYSNCLPSVAVGAGVEISLSCTPAYSGSLAAVLQLNSNDLDEPQSSFALACQGQVDLIFSNGFED